MKDGHGERLSCLARNWRRSRQGKKASRPLRMPIEPSIARRSRSDMPHRGPQWVSQLAGLKDYGNGIIWRRPVGSVFPEHTQI